MGFASLSLAFPSFDEFNLHSASEFKRRAGSFMAHETQRHTISHTGRKAVMRHFSFRTVMDCFLGKMPDYQAFAR
jgi:hypothetical protein